ncbi:xanthine/uracil permease family protein-like protein [Amylocarpus encephaloides]|uniref:Xanthine/uracil permease family protein-like protein n=1 Tax=Amylocarpus encephaloides TaxID=45428 RepID=A0A9P7YB57_9HELO|nr:xanthine/uracil permease family protein-like protein [Amylocarpus encephaloides]
MKEYLKALDTRLSSSTFVSNADTLKRNQRPGSSFFTEINAGLTTFFTMAYIIAVNASIVADSGGTCVNPEDKLRYDSCLVGVKRDLVTATAAIAGIGSVAFGFFTNLPVAIAPGMGLNAYFTYQVVGYHGSGSISYQLALTSVFMEGFIFLFLSLIGMRQWLVKIIPGSIKVASGVGIGLFLTEIGLSAAGIGMISGARDSPTDLAGCPSKYINEHTGACVSHKMTSPTMWIGILCGGVPTAWLMRNTSFTYFPNTPDGHHMHEFFTKVVSFHPIQNSLAVLDWNISAAGGHFALALFTFLYVDIIDSTATLYSMARFSGVTDPDTGDFPRSTLAYCCDAITISIGALLGCSPATAFIESGAGITDGGRTGLTAMTTGVCFLISIFFAPIFASIPPWATGCTLVLVGCMMMRQVTAVNWSFIGDALPAFITIAAMPLTYSVAYGLIAGIFSYSILNGLIAVTRKLSGGRIQPPDADNAEYWTYKPSDEHPPWFIRATKGQLWRSNHSVAEIQGGDQCAERKLDYSGD